MSLTWPTLDFMAFVLTAKKTSKMNPNNMAKPFFRGRVACRQQQQAMKEVERLESVGRSDLAQMAKKLCRLYCDQDEDTFITSQ